MNPSGKLPFSYPKYTGHFAPHNHKPSDVYFFNPEEANDIHQTEKSVWEWPFGFGLSYTEFEYSSLQLSDTLLTGTGNLTAQITITNTGDRQGTETAIWYLRDEVGTITRPVKEVKHFERVSLEPGESRTISFTIKPDEHLSFPDSNGSLLLEQGYFTLKIAGKSARFFLEKAGTGATY